MSVTDSRLLKGTLTFGDVATANNFQAQITNLVIEQQDGDSDDTVVTLSGDSVGGGTSPGAWHATGTMIQDFDQSGGVGMQQWSYENRGTDQPFTFTPNDKATSPSITGTIGVKFLGIGGDTNTRVTRDFDWAIPGEPTVTWGSGTGAVAATGATAGSPGTFTPAGSTAPADAAALAALAASPASAWTTGQYVVAGDASEHYWDGSAWATGQAASAAA